MAVSVFISIQFRYAFLTFGPSCSSSCLFSKRYRFAGLFFQAYISKLRCRSIPWIHVLTGVQHFGCLA